jgi:hypothetical protein
MVSYLEWGNQPGLRDDAAVVHDDVQCVRDGRMLCATTQLVLD